MRTRTRALVFALAAGCGSDDGGGAASTGDGTAGVDPGDTTGASTNAPTDSGVDASTMADGGDASSGGGGGGSGLVVPCDDDGSADPDLGIICFFDVVGHPMEPAATIEHSIGDFNGEQALYIRLSLAPWFVDNTYGANAIGWTAHDHKFKDLVGSDHAEIHLKDPSGVTVFHFATDYLSETMDLPSGYSSLGIWGGEGEMIAGDAAAVLAANSSISRNLNDRGYDEYVVDSPATDENYTPNPDAMDWDYRVVYEVWIALSGFPLEQLPVSACIENIHASPSKVDSNTVDVVPDECPPGWGCWKDGGCGECDAYDPDFGDLCDPTDGLPPEG